jgi:preprotein translocase subunit YajC
MEFPILALLMLLGLGAYWSMVVYPKQRDFNKRQKYVRTLIEGDEVVTYGGVIGKIKRLEAEQGIAHVEIAPGIVVRLVTAALIQPYDAEEIAKAAQKGLEQEQATSSGN